MILHLTTLDTRNYRFEAPGLTEDEARAALEQACNTHAEQTGADDWSEFSGDVTVEALETGTAYRDGSPIATLEREQPASTNTSPAERHDLDSTPDGTLIPQTIVHLTASMPYGAQAGRVPRTLEELETWLTGLRSVLAGVARDQDSDRRDLSILLEQRDAVRAFLGTGEHA